MSVLPRIGASLDSADVRELGLRLAWWGTAWLRGYVVADDLLDAVIGDDATHLVASPEGPVEPLMLGLGRLRALGLTELGLALPVEGDPLGLGGPRELNDAALDAGVAVVGAAIGLVPVRVGAAVTWHMLAASRRQLPDVGEASRSLRAALPSAADRLAALDVAHWRPEVADALMNLRHLSLPRAPHGVPAACVELAARGHQALAIVDLALEDDGGALSSYEISARREALAGLERAARRAVAAAGSPEVWPQ